MGKQLSGFNIPTLEDGKQIVVAAAPAVAPIIIHQHHTNSSNDGKNQLVSIAIKVAIGGTACWLGYVVVTTALPDYVQEFFPVTRKFFAKTSKFLQASIDKVKEVVGEQIQKYEVEKRRLSDSVTRKTPISMISPDPTTMQSKKPLLPDNNLLIRESRADSDMDSLEDVHSILGIHKPPTTDGGRRSSSSSRSIASTARTSFLSVFN